jgi:hypothetical protein
MKDVASSSAVLGTWTFQTQSKSDVGYYKGSAFVVMHLMTDPLSMLGCQLESCSELNNQICQQEDQCLDTQHKVVEWSDGAYTINWNIYQSQYKRLSHPSFVFLVLVAGYLIFFFDYF